MRPTAISAQKAAVSTCGGREVRRVSVSPLTSVRPANETAWPRFRVQARSGATHLSDCAHFTLQMTKQRRERSRRRVWAGRRVTSLRHLCRK